MRTSYAILASALIMLSPAVQAQTPEEIAAAALEAAPVFDGHNDVPDQLRERYQDLYKAP